MAYLIFIIKLFVSFGPFPNIANAEHGSNEHGNDRIENYKSYNQPQNYETNCKNRSDCQRNEKNTNKVMQGISDFKYEVGDKFF